MTTQTAKHLPEVVAIAIAAGAEILQVYGGEFKVDIKGDGSPVTEADRRAHELIRRELKKLTPDIPLLSEESDAKTHAARRQWQRYWLVDPLDGTKEFVKRSDDFTVNIALIENARPVLGVVHAPVTAKSYYAAQSTAAYMHDGEREVAINVRQFNRKQAVMVASRRHSSAAVEAYRARLAEVAEQVKVTGMGSSLKICRVAEGRADIYPRLAPTSEWDTAAADCVLCAAGGAVVTLGGAPLAYSKADILNPWFLACGDPGVDWVGLAEGLAAN